MKSSIAFMVIVLLIVIGVAFFFIPATPLPNGGVAEACEEHQGTWLSEHSECEYPDSKEWCEEAGGQFLECESACRHDPEAEICTMQCVIVCKF